MNDKEYRMLKFIEYILSKIESGVSKLRYNIRVYRVYRDYNKE